MRYLLVVGFHCDVYRKEPQARIFFGNKLIDEFYIPNCKDTLPTVIKEFSQNRHILQPFLENEWTNIYTKNFPPLRFYEIEIDTTLDRIELRIEIKNSDSNYTNGFITNSTLINLNVCYFFPLHKKLLLRLEKIRNKNRTTQKYAWYWLPKNRIFDLVRNSLCWQGKNRQIFVGSTANHQQGWTLGGDGVFTCELVKKYQILINKPKKSNKYNFNSILVEYFLNKYEQHANQRNTS